MTWRILTCLLSLLSVAWAKAPFIPLDTVHQAFSQFQVNLILNENRNHPIVLTTVSNEQSKNYATSVLKDAHALAPYAGFSVVVDCRDFQKNLNGTLGICATYAPAKTQADVEVGADSHFSCQFFIPSELKIKEKGHVLMKNHNQETLPDGQHFNAEYISEVIRKNVPDFVFYVEDEYELTEFLQQKSDFKASKLPKLLYFDQNLLAPVFVRKLSALMDNKIEVAVTDDPPIVKLFNSSFDSLILLEYSFDKKRYTHRTINFNQQESPQKSIMEDERISKYLQVKKARDILLDFEHSNYSINQFSSLDQLEYLQTQGRPIVLQISGVENSYHCPKLPQIAGKHLTLFNYVCYNHGSRKDLDKSEAKHQNQLYFIVESIAGGVWYPSSQNFLQRVPQNVTRQRVSTETEAELCLKTAIASQRDPIFYYFQDKSHSESILIMNYLNSLHEVTSLLYFCQIVLPDAELVKKYAVKPNSMFSMADPDKSGNMRKLEHSQVSTFIDIKMFLREISIQKMLKVYEDRLINNEVQKIETSEQLTDKCFNRKCIVALLATGRYREEEEIKMIKELKLQYEQLFKFVWIDGICHWDVPKQLKLLKKKEKVIDRSYVFFYNEKDITYSLWESKKFWDKKELEKWIKSLRSTRVINHLKFAIDIEDRICKKKKQSPMLPDQL